MAANTQPIFASQPVSNSVRLKDTYGVLETGADSVLLLSAGADGTRVHAVLASLTGSEAGSTILRLWRHDGVNYFCIGSILIPPHTKSTTVANPCVNMLDPEQMPWLDPAEPYITLNNGESLYVSIETQPTNYVHVTAFGGNY